MGQIINAAGLKGEVKVYPYTDYKERFSELPWVYLEDEKIDIEKVRYQGELAIIQFAGVDDRTAAEGCKGKYLYVDRQDARKLPEDTYFVADLIGLTVVDENGRIIGRLSDVIQNAAQDLYEVEITDENGESMETKKTFLIPAVEEFIFLIDMENQKIHVRLIEGLL